MDYISARISKNLIVCNGSLREEAIKSLRGKIWHYRRVYVVKDQSSKHYKLNLNIFERIWLTIRFKSVDNFLKVILKGKLAKAAADTNLKAVADERFTHTKKEQNKTENIPVSSSTNLNLENMPISFFQKITPENIDKILNIKADGWCRSIKENYFTTTKGNFGGKIDYSISFQYKQNSWMSHGIEVSEGKFCLDTDNLKFTNFGEYLKYLAEGKFYQGKFFNRKFYIIPLASGKEARIYREEILKI